MSFVRSIWLTAILFGIIVLLLYIQHLIMTRAQSGWNEFQTRQAADDQSTALVQAIEQYCVDFPNSAAPANNHEWRDELGGKNDKHIIYLKTDRYPQDSTGRLLDPKGFPYEVTSQDHTFQVRSTGFPESGTAVGDRFDPKF